MSKNEYFHHVKYEIDKFRHLAYGCRDIAIILRQLKFEKSQSTNTFHNERKKFSNRCSFSKAKGKTNSNHDVLGLWQRLLRLHDVIAFGHNCRLYPKDQE